MNIPKIRFKEFSKNWIYDSLNKLLRVSKEKNSQLLFTKNDVLSVSRDFGVVNQIAHLGRSYAGASVHNYGILNKGDIVYTKSPLSKNPYGIIKLNKYKSGIVSTLYAIYKVNIKKALGEFLDYYFSLNANTNRYLRPLVRKGAKNDMKINNEYVLNDKIYFPSLPEQKKIVSFLTSVEGKLNQLIKKKELLEQYKKGMKQKIFSQDLRFKDDNGNMYPDWDEKRIGDVFEERNEKNFIDMELLSVSIEKGIFPQSESIKKDNSNTDKSKYKRVLKGDIAYNSMRMWQGASAVSNQNGIISPAYTVLKSNDYNNSLFFGYLFKMTFMIQLFQKYSQGMTSDTWNLKYHMISPIKIIVPHLNEQKKIAKFLSAIDNKIDLVSTQIKNTKTFKKGLLQQMFV